MQPIISVVIATKDRNDKLSLCINSIKNGTFKDFEIIICDQGNPQKSKFKISESQCKKIKHMYVKGRGKSLSINKAITIASGEIIACIDDDCIADRLWLYSMYSAFKQNPNIAAVFGNILPYKPLLNPNLVCPSTFISKTSLVITNPYNIHFRDVGLGHNMGIRRSTIDKIGLFKEWLGAGRGIIGGGEESEYIYRLLYNGYLILRYPDSIIYHNRWISQSDNRILDYRHGTGFYSFIFYYLFHDPKIIRIFLEFIKYRFPIFILKLIKTGKIKTCWYYKKDIVSIIPELFCILYAAIMSILYNIRDLFNSQRNNHIKHII